MANHYFLISSLPYLMREAPPPLSSQAFLEACSQQVSPREFEALATLSLLPREPACCEAEAGWNAAEVAIRNRLVRLRAARLNRDGSAYMRPYIDRFAGLDEQVGSAFDSGDPQAAARAIDAIRWAVLDDLEAREVFTFGRLVIYRLKLLLLEKWEGLNPESGARELDLVIDSKLKSLDIPELAYG